MQTIQAMKKIADIRERRENRFWDTRMKLARVQKVYDMEKEVLTHSHLVSNKEVRQELVEKIKVKENLKEALKQENRAKKGTLRIEEE